MYKRTFLLVALIFILTSTVAAQKTKSKRIEQPNVTPQISLEQRLGELSKEISDELTESQKKTVAVAEFVDLNGRVTDFGKFLSEELITRLFKTKKFKVVERQLLNRVLAEQKLSLTEMIEASSAKRIGRILGVEAIVSGTISDLSKSFRVNARIISTETGELLAAAATEVAKDEDVCRLINCGTASSVTSRVDAQPLLTPTPQPTSISPAPKPSIQKIEDHSIIFDLQQCRSSGTSITCNFSLTNSGQDRRFVFVANESKLYDELGNGYDGASAQVANQSGSSPRVGFVSGVTAKARMTFEGIDPNATQITLLRVHYDVGDNIGLDIMFRNVPLTKAR